MEERARLPAAHQGNRDQTNPNHTLTRPLTRPLSLTLPLTLTLTLTQALNPNLTLTKAFLIETKQRAVHVWPESMRSCVCALVQHNRQLTQVGLTLTLTRTPTLTLTLTPTRTRGLTLTLTLTLAQVFARILLARVSANHLRPTVIRLRVRVRVRVSVRVRVRITVTLRP